ncbi:MAG: leucine--tRNA ligase, partial [Thaumarchaeota archaeon]|nr:leucine--tRNA ligase [Nitrososphaerota archaeon]
FVTVAYPYPNSPQHIGHGRTYTLADVHARYKRMRGYNVLFPMAFHYTGTPILAMAKRIAAGDRDLIDTFSGVYKVDENDIKSFHDPLKIAQYFHREIKDGMIEIGYSIDWRREFTTIDPAYSRFIEWQFRRLSEQGLITRGSHPVGWCPNDGNPVGQHDTLGDIEPEISEFVLIKFVVGDDILPSATLRCETIFGVTNLWVKPDADYVRADVDGESWIISQSAATKLIFLGKKVIVKDTISASTLIGRPAKNPITNSVVPILPADFVDLEQTTGIVMSVPGHAPFDYQALEKLKLKPRPEEMKEEISRLTPIKIIETEEFSGIPAAQIIQKKGIELHDDSKLEDATSQLYAKEFQKGTMMENTGIYSGMDVSKARELVKNDLLNAGHSSVMHELINGPIICRCGTKCTVKIFENQWFINYGDAAWKEKASACLEQMNILPVEILDEFHYVIGWLRGRACARGSGLGTKLPWDDSWIIESLSDSVIYMSYYTIARLISKHKIQPSQLSDKVFNYLFLHNGNLSEISNVSGIKEDIIESMRKEFDYFYPVDTRHSGRDLVPNHLTFFIFNHAAIFPKKFWPRQIVTNGSVLMDGKKMSKSFGNIIPLRQAVQSHGADPLRMAILSSAELLQDADFSFDLVRTYRERLERFHSFAESVIDTKGNGVEVQRSEGKWLLSRLQRIIADTTEAIEKLRVREAINHAVHRLDQDIQWYNRRISARKESTEDSSFLFRAVLDVKVRLLAPFCPFICEEIWAKIGNEGLVCEASWPTADPEKIDGRIEEEESLVKLLLEDTQNILRVTKIKPNQITYYLPAPWKEEAYSKILAIALEGQPEIGNVMKSLMQDEAMKTKGKEVPIFTQRALKEVNSLSKETKDMRRQIGRLDGMKIMADVQAFLERELNSKIQFFEEEDGSKYDPKGRASTAIPFRPAIFVE